MNVRFAEACRDKFLELERVERDIAAESGSDGIRPEVKAMQCLQDIHIGVFFDGTNNNKYRDTPTHSHSNVARLYEVFPGTPAEQKAPTLRPRVNLDGSTAERPIFADAGFKAPFVPEQELPYFRKIYIPGLGTPMPDSGDSGIGAHKTFGLAMAGLGQVRLDWAMLQLCNQVHAALFQTPLEPFVDMQAALHRSRAGPAALTMLPPPLWLSYPLADALKAQWDRLRASYGTYDPAVFNRILADYERRLAAQIKKRGTTKPCLRKIRLCVVGFSRGAAMARVWVNAIHKRWGHAFCGIELQVDFLGLFDTVASVGIAQSVPLANGHMDWADGTNMVVPASVKRCVHLVSAHEVRGSFPLDSVCQGESLPRNCKEIVYPGVHSDVGGGYPPDDQGRSSQGDSFKLSQIPLAQMYREARMAGVPLAPMTEMSDAQRANFAIAPALRETFNLYIEATRSGSVPATQGKGEASFARMFPTETQPRETLTRVMRRHYAHQLQWRKSLLEGRSVGIAGLAEPLGARSITRHQDIEDLRGAEQELREEIAFLRSTDPKKFEVLNHHNDLLTDVAYKGVVHAAEKRQRGLARLHLETASWAQLPPVDLARHKQAQWDQWLRDDWERGDPAFTPDKARKAWPLFEQCVHDSRAWFKPFGRSDGLGRAPDDEDWFVLGGREEERKLHIAALADLDRALARTDDHASKRDIKQRLEQLKQEGQPLVHGGREPYRLWGYLRHRRIYQSGVLKDDRHAVRQQAVDAEETQRLREQQRQAAVDAATVEHEAEVKKIRDQHWTAMRSGHLKTQAEQDEYLEGTRRRIARENASYQGRLQRIDDARADQGIAHLR